MCGTKYKPVASPLAAGKSQDPKKKPPKSLLLETLKRRPLLLKLLLEWNYNTPRV